MEMQSYFSRNVSHLPIVSFSMHLPKDVTGAHFTLWKCEAIFQ